MIERIDMGLFNLPKENIEAVLNYILESEVDDFRENTSDNHVFFHALVCAYDRKYAENILELAIKGEVF